MIKKCISVILALLCIGLIPIQANAEELDTILNESEIEEVVNSIGLINSGSVECSVGTKKIHIKMETIGSSLNNENGFKEIQIQRYSGGDWHTEKTIASVITTNAYTYYISDYTASVLGGYYYRVVLNHYAKKGSTTERVGNTSNSVWIA